MIRREKLTPGTKALSGIPGSGYLYCGRPSPFGNPFRVVPFPDCRDEMVDVYPREANTYHSNKTAVDAFAEYWTGKRVGTVTYPEGLRERFLIAARRAWNPKTGITLLCYCGPREVCHTDVLVAFLEYTADRKEKK